MKNKISLAACTGMSALGLVSRAAVSDYVEENDGIVSICITSTATDKKAALNLIKRFPIIAINGCDNACVNKILKSKDVDVKNTIDVSKHVKNYNPKNISRLKENEVCVDLIKNEIDKTIENLTSQ